MRELVSRSLGKLRCESCGNISLFIIIGKTRNYSNMDLEYVCECQTCFHHQLISKEYVKELLD